jgi:hypothetical protein
MEDTDEITEKINKIQRQTNYTKEEAREKLKQNNNCYISTIKEYLGVPEKKPSKIISVNQEIYKQLRNKLNSDMSDYNNRIQKDV